MNTLGHIYVCSVNMNMTMGCFRTIYNTTADFHKTIKFAPIFYFVSAIITLRGPNDVSSTQCDNSLEHCSDKPYTWQECLNYNQNVWFLAYLLGLQTTYLDQGFIKQWYFSAEQIKTFGLGLWSFTFFIAGIVVYITCYMTVTYYSAGVMDFYFLFISLQILVLILITNHYKGKKELHLHHYLIAMMAVSCMGYQTYQVTILHGILNGMMIEGGGRWGYDPIWYTYNQIYEWLFRKE